MPHKKHPQRSQALNFSFWVDYCQRIFSKDIAKPNVRDVNGRYGGKHIKADNIFFFTANEDPWQYVGMRKLSDPTETQKNLKNWLIQCTDCAHCIDLGVDKESDPDNLKKGRALAVKTIGQWLDEDLERKGYKTQNASLPQDTSSPFFKKVTKHFAPFFEEVTGDSITFL